MGHGAAPGGSHGPPGGALPTRQARPVSRRKVIWAAAGIPLAAVAGAVGWESSRRGEAATTAPRSPLPGPPPRRGPGPALAGPHAVRPRRGPGRRGRPGDHGRRPRRPARQPGARAGRRVRAAGLETHGLRRDRPGGRHGPGRLPGHRAGIRGPGQRRLGQLWTSPHTALYGPVEADGTVYVAEGTLYALRARDGGLRWQYPADVTSHPVVAGGMLYTLGVKGGSRRTVLHAIRTADGAHQWDTPAPPGGVLATDGQVVCAVEGEEVGEPGGASGSGGPATASRCGTGPGAPITAPRPCRGGVLYVVRADGTLIAYRAASGTPLWTAPSTVGITPAVSAGVVYASDDFGRLAARRAADGKVTWTVPHRFTEGPLVAGQTVIVTNGRSVLGIPV